MREREKAKRSDEDKGERRRKERKGIKKRVKKGEGKKQEKKEKWGEQENREKKKKKKRRNISKTGKGGGARGTIRERERGQKSSLIPRYAAHSCTSPAITLAVLKTMD